MDFPDARYTRAPSLILNGGAPSSEKFTIHIRRFRQTLFRAAAERILSNATPFFFPLSFSLSAILQRDSSYDGSSIDQRIDDRIFSARSHRFASPFLLLSASFAKIRRTVRRWIVQSELRLVTTRLFAKGEKYGRRVSWKENDDSLLLITRLESQRLSLNATDSTNYARLRERGSAIRTHLSTLSCGSRDLERSYAYVGVLDAAIKSRTERGERSVQTSTTEIFYQRGSRSPPIAKRRGESRRDKFSNATAVLSVDSYFRESRSVFRRELAEGFVVPRSRAYGFSLVSERLRK